VALNSVTLVQGGVFSSNYLVFKLVTMPQNWQVERKMNHFEKLRNQLVRMYPGYQVDFIRFLLLI